jgi:large subunit ribosomal protein L15
MATRLRKVRRLRGSRTHGWGQIGQHRSTGHKGGHGKAGLHKHHWTRTVMFDDEHFGPGGFKPPKQNVTRRWVNVGELDDLFLKYGKVEEGKNVLDLDALGIDKLLGAGNLSKKYSIVTKAFAKNAKSKVESLGGEVIVC